MTNIESSVPKSNAHPDLDLFFNSAKVLFCIAGFDGYFKKVNPMVSETLGFTTEELMSRPVNSFIYPEDQAVTEDWRQRLREGSILNNFENRYLTKTGEVVWLSWTSVPNPDLQLVFAVAKNITSKKLEELARNDSEQQLKETVYTAMHDLRSPVANMISLLDLCIRPGTLAFPDDLEPVSMLKSSIHDLKIKMDAYLERLIHNDQKTPGVPTIEFAEVLTRVRTMLYAIINETGAVIKTDFSRAETISFHPADLESILLNLISNSIKYRHPDVPPMIELISDINQNNIELTIRDNGLGFDQQALGEKIFEFGQRFHEHTEGKGIGLYLVRRQLQKSGGSIRAESQPGKGTTFYLSFGPA